MTGIRKTVTMIGGAATLALTVGFGGLATDNAATGPLTSPASSAHTTVLASGCILGLPPC
jgi:hypothetical protein